VAKLAAALDAPRDEREAQEDVEDTEGEEEIDAAEGVDETVAEQANTSHKRTISKTSPSPTTFTTRAGRVTRRRTQKGSDDDN
jgi:hypothetical protein